MEVPRHVINLGHAAIIAPAIGYLGWKAYNEEPIEISKNIGIALLIIALIIIIYHLYTLVNVSYPSYKKNADLEEVPVGEESSEY